MIVHNKQNVICSTKYDHTHSQIFYTLALLLVSTSQTLNISVPPSQTQAYQCKHALPTVSQSLNSHLVKLHYDYALGTNLKKKERRATR